MSHYATINVKALDDVQVSMVREAVRRLDKRYTIEQLSKLNIPSYGDFNAALMIEGAPSKIRFNFKRHSDNHISLTVGGETWRSGVADFNGFVNGLTREYSQLKIEQIAKEQRMIPVSRKVNENGDVVLRFALAA